MKHAKIQLILKPIIFAIVITIMLNIILLSVLTVFQMQYWKNALNQDTAYNLMSQKNEKSIETYYLNGEGDVDEINSALISDLLHKYQLTKIDSKIKSYIVLLTLTRNNFILSGKAVPIPFEETESKLQEIDDSDSDITIYKKGKTVYIVREKKQEDYSKGSREFAIYTSSDSEFTEEIIKQRSQIKKYNFTILEWRRDIERFNRDGKLLIMSMLLEFAVCYTILRYIKKKRPVKQRTGDGSKPLKRSE